MDNSNLSFGQLVTAAIIAAVVGFLVLLVSVWVGLDLIAGFGFSLKEIVGITVAASFLVSNTSRG